MKETESQTGEFSKCQARERSQSPNHGHSNIIFDAAISQLSRGELPSITLYKEYAEMNLVSNRDNNVYINDLNLKNSRSRDREEDKDSLY